MLFNTLEFLFLFLPLVYIGFLLLHFAGNRTLQLGWLSIASLIFYSWWNPSYLILMLLSIAANYLLSLAITATATKAYHRLFLILGLLFNIGLLAYFKYANFFVDNINIILSNDINLKTIILPLAISFFTFQQIAYLVDSYKGITQPHSFIEYCLFVTFFPQLIAGPIVHHREMLSQFQQLNQRTDHLRNLVIGLTILAIGLFKKVVIADSFAQFSTPLFNQVSAGGTVTTLDAVTGILGYTFQLYFDFSGYSDMAIGLACLFGIKLPVNFFSPYKATSIIEFWRRWHITLSRFLRDYLYIPLGGNRHGKAKRYRNLIITMLLGGLWHGASWNFVVWGGLHGAYLITNHLWRQFTRESKPFLNTRIMQPAYWVVTFFAVVIAWIFFRAETMHSAIQILQSLPRLELNKFSLPYLIALQQSNIVGFINAFFPQVSTGKLVFAMLTTAFLACWALPNTYQLFITQNIAILDRSIDRKSRFNFKWRGNFQWAALTACLLTISFMGLTEVSEFIYFQF